MRTTSTEEAAMKLKVIFIASVLKIKQIGQLASMIMAVNVLAEKNPIVLDHVALLLVVGEEVDHIGMSVKFY